MRRNLSRFADRAFDLLVVGAGIHGACAAWDATLRGLSVAIVDQDDFGGATSANSLGIVHGGLRYLARGDFPRMIESIQERSALLRIAPDLVQPLPVLVATHGHGLRSRWAHRVALASNDLFSLDRNRGLAPEQAIPRGRLVSRSECLRQFPSFSPGHGLTGGAVWYDAQLRHPERLTLSFLRSASSRGAEVANYVRVHGLRVISGAVESAMATDVVDGKSVTIRARAVLVAAGPWSAEIVAQAIPETRHSGGATHALGVNVVLNRRLSEVGVGVEGRSGLERDPVGGGRRFFFLAPQGRTTLLGTWYSLADRSGPVRGEVERSARLLLDELNEACPGLGLRSTDIVRQHWGWLPLKAGFEPGRPDALADRPRVLDHGGDGIRGLFSMEGVKYTTARRVAERAVDRVFDGLGRQSPPCLTSTVPLDSSGEPDVVHAIREEMAIKLADIVFRRSTLGEAPGPDRAAVEAAARTAGIELGWSATRQEAEIEEVMRQSGMPGATAEAVG
jgi:glycerol-3-phosphate dehydrogenase